MNSKESGVAPVSSFNSLIPGTATAATPPWFVRTVSRREIGRGRGHSTTWKPSDRSRRRLTESESCHVSTSSKMSIDESRRTSRISSTLLANESMLKHPNDKFGPIDVECRSTCTRSTDGGRNLTARGVRRFPTMIAAPLPAGKYDADDRRDWPERRPR